MKRKKLKHVLEKGNEKKRKKIDEDEQQLWVE